MEMVVALGVLSLVSGMVMTLISQMGNVATFYSSKEDYDSIYRSVQLLLLNDTTCKYALQNAGAVMTFNPDATPVVPPADRPQVTLDTIFMVNPQAPPAGVAMLTTGNNYTSRISVAKMYLSEHSVDATGKGLGRSKIPIADPVSGKVTSYDSYIVDLNIAVANVKPVLPGPPPPGPPAAAKATPIAIKPIPLTVLVDAGHKIFSCFAQASTASVCSALGVTVGANGECQLPECWAGMTTPPTCNKPSGATCTGQIFFLAYQYSTTNPSPPVCTCMQTCALPGAAGPAGPPGPGGGPAPAPVFGGY
jgi:hypothetical protein